MLGRRKHARYTLSEPVAANLRLREEVAIEEWDEGQVVVLSPEPFKADEQVTLEIPGDPKRRTTARVSESKPAIVGDGVIRHRVVLKTDDGEVTGGNRGGGQGA